MLRVGIYGGNFNPFHKGHLLVAETSYRVLGLDKIIIVPTGKPAHREPAKISSSHRMKIIELLLEDLRFGLNYEVSDYELSSQNTSYTYNTLQHFRELYPAEQLNFICGADIFESITSWGEYKSLPEYANFAIITRNSSQLAYIKSIALNIVPEDRIHYNCWLNTPQGDVVLVEMESVEVSSSAIRKSKEIDVEHLNHKALDYIKKNNLYGV